MYAGVAVEPSLLGPILEIHLCVRAVVLAVVRVRVRVRANQANLTLTRRSACVSEQLYWPWFVSLHMRQRPPG